MGLFSPKWESLDPRKALSWIEKHGGNLEELRKAAFPLFQKSGRLRWIACPIRRCLKTLLLTIVSKQ